MNVIRSAYVNEIHTVQNLAGKVIAQYPETESAFLEALGDRDRENADAGAGILSHYGYDETERIKENKSYAHVVIELFCVLGAFYLLILIYIHIYLGRTDRRRQRQENQVLSILENIWAGDYRFMEDEALSEKLDNPLFSDTLIKIGKNLKMKTEYLREEQDNTKMLVTDISHQLKTPLSALKVCFPLCMEAENAAEREEFRERCSMQMDKLEVLAAALVHISHLETHIIRLHPEKEFLIDILTESVNMVYEKAMEKQITIENVSGQTDETEDICVCADKKWTVEAVANVLDNAVKYSPAGGSIKLRVQKLYSFIRIEIEDNGIGIPKEERNQIFRRFYRGGNDVVRKSEGVGVGLYLSRKILEDEGGSIFVRPAKEKGSIFVLQLPIASL